MLEFITGITVIFLAIAGLIGALTLIVNRFTSLIKAIKKAVFVCQRLHDFFS
jgi:hypothetical protein